MGDEELSSFGQHLEELRRTLLKMFGTILIGMAVAAFFYPTLFQWISAPLHEISTQFLSTHSATANVPPLLILKPTEGLIVALKICFWTGLVATSPLWLWQFLFFLLPALRAEEKRAIVPFMIATLLFFFLGILFSVQVVIPLANHYLAVFNLEMGFNMWSLSHYIDYTFILLFGNGLAFEVAVLLFFLVHYHWASAAMLIEKRKYFIVCAFIFAAIVTPPDVLTQLLLAIPLSLLYEFAILYAKIRSKFFLNKKT